MFRERGGDWGEGEVKRGRHREGKREIKIL